MKVADQLSALIESNEIKPGERFPAERSLAEQLGVSRPVVREAMIALELTGVIEIRSGSGIYVKEQQPKLKPSFFDQGVGPFEILEARIQIEPEACALAATRITREQLKQLRAALQEMSAEAASENGCESADWKFHTIIAEACQNTVLHEIVDWLWKLRNQSNLSLAFFQRIRTEGIHPVIEDHQKIVDALEEHNPDKARKEMLSHLKNSTEAAASHFNS